MFTANGHYKELQGNYLFTTVAKRVAAYKDAHPDADIIRMGIGDVTKPLVPAVIAALHNAVEEMAHAETFRGYGPECGYAFLREAILARDFTPRGVQFDSDEVFVSDGAKCDVGNIQELFGDDCTVGVLDPVYPVYVDTNVMSGRAGRFLPDARAYENIVYLPCTAENGFVPELPKKKIDVLYLCYPNNPTGTVLTKAQLSKFVEYALKNGSLILFDAAYEIFITEPDVPHSIYEIEGAKECAIEFRSFSKTAGFTGARCAYTIVPRAIRAKDAGGAAVSLRDMWARRMTTKFNGASYIMQRAAEAALLDEGYAQILAVAAGYLENARIMREALHGAGYKIFGGVNSPYIWVRTPGGDSWKFFDELLDHYHIVGTPGAGFGAAGEGYLRMTAFNSREDTVRAMERIRKG